MLNPLYLVWLGAALNLLAGLHYTYSTVRAPSGAEARPKPNPVSWGIWSLSGWLAFFGQISEGVRNEALLTLCVAAVPTFIFLAALVSRRRYGVYAPISRLDMICGGLAILALAAWRVTDSGSVAVALSIVCDALVAIPVVRQAYRDPDSDSPSIWVTGAVNAIITLATFQSFTFLTSGFALYFLGLCLLVSFLLVVHPRLRSWVRLSRVRLVPEVQAATEIRSFDTAAAFAGAFAADYLSWDEDDPQRRATALTAYIDGTADAQWGWSGRGRQRADLVLLENVELAPDGYYVVDVRVRVAPTMAWSMRDSRQEPIIRVADPYAEPMNEAGSSEAAVQIPLPGSPGSTKRNVVHAVARACWFSMQVPVVVRSGRFCVPT